MATAAHVGSFVSRAAPQKNQQHVVLAAETFKPAHFAAQLSLDMSVGWGIVHYLAKAMLKHESGKYVVLKDAMKVCAARLACIHPTLRQAVLRIYRVPEDTDSEGDDA